MVTGFVADYASELEFLTVFILSHMCEQNMNTI